MNLLRIYKLNLNKNYNSLIPGLTLIPGYFYFWSKNITIFTGAAFLASTLLLFFVVLIIYLFCELIIYPIIIKFNTNKLSRPVFYIFLAGLSSFFSFYILDYHFYLQRRLWGIVAFLIFFLIFKYNFQKLLLNFLFVFIFITGGAFLYKFVTFKIEDKNIITNLDLPTREIKFKQFPNIYIYWLESFHGLDILKKTFKIDTVELESYLKNKDFVIIPNVLSSGFHTTHSMSQLYLTRNFVLPNSLNHHSEVTWGFRDIIGGNEQNYVYKVLKDNGYRTYLILREFLSYYLNTQGPFLDEITFKPSIINIYFSPIYDFVHPGIKKLLNLHKDYWFYGHQMVNGYGSNFVENVKHAITRARKENAPYIISFKGGMNHSPSDGPHQYTWKNRDEWINSNFYQDFYSRSLIETEEILNYILKIDPASLIILIGDHGTFTYRWFPTHDENAYKEANLTKQDLADDLFDVFLAYRMPNGEKFDLAHGMYMNNINLFTHIFSWLAQDNEILKDRIPSESQYLNVLHAIEGVVQ